jgi:single-strand DNA-binding protein
MSSVNKAIIIGRLGKDPEVRFTQSGTAISNLSVATSYKPKDKDAVTEWHKITCIGRLAEVCGEYLHKGSLAYFEGRLQTRKWQDKDGNDRYTTEIIAERMQMLGGKNGESGTREQPAAGSQNWDDQGMPDDDVPF